uniref:Uncharacterized protein n=1 Tax=Chromera velia CCMP2878 TaxID=1169474 RepID=A0A0G4IAR7_9ALVE|eukprot:Cvel_12531.t1-p1 / transcript=Cvel_12531.t1 / gene=Cvel_12531 / organism=Chromera_velia_CCMP2878 / gene_product=hypothetical protein / transcript_product=hypothetical protein / location=Cvel_scaffold823:3391-4950(-) / protein_length=520 / sequence_SO=supercontig / SO=protein_coding / is_pseudo=false
MQNRSTPPLGPPPRTPVSIRARASSRDDHGGGGGAGGSGGATLSIPQQSPSDAIMGLQAASSPNSDKGTPPIPTHAQRAGASNSNRGKPPTSFPPSFPTESGPERPAVASRRGPPSTSPFPPPSQNPFGHTAPAAAQKASSGDTPQRGPELSATSEFRPLDSSPPFHGQAVSLSHPPTTTPQGREEEPRGRTGESPQIDHPFSTNERPPSFAGVGSFSTGPAATPEFAPPPSGDIHLEHSRSGGGDRDGGTIQEGITHAATSSTTMSATDASNDTHNKSKGRYGNVFNRDTSPSPAVTHPPAAAQRSPNVNANMPNSAFSTPRADLSRPPRPPHSSSPSPAPTPGNSGPPSAHVSPTPSRKGVGQLSYADSILTPNANSVRGRRPAGSVGAGETQQQYSSSKRGEEKYGGGRRVRRSPASSSSSVCFCCRLFSPFWALLWCLGAMVSRIAHTLRTLVFFAVLALLCWIVWSLVEESPLVGGPGPSPDLLTSVSSDVVNEGGGTWASKIGHGGGLSFDAVG